MSRELERDAFRRLRTELHDSQRHHYGLKTKTVSSSSYQDTVQRSTRENLDISLHRSIRDAANMPIFLEDTHKSNVLSRDFNSGYDSNIQSSNIRSHTTPVSAALEALQSYGPVTQSSSHSSMQRDWNLTFPKNINKPAEKLQSLLSSMLKSKDSNVQTFSAESSTMSTSDISCPPFGDLNLNNVDEEDEYLYGDSNSLPEMPQLVKTDSDQSNVKADRPGWSDDEDLFGESSVTSRNESNLDQMKNSNVWSLRNKNIQLKLSQKHEGNTNDSSRNMPHETYSVEQQHSSVSSAECQNIRDLPNKIPEKDVKNIMPVKDSNVTSTSSVKSKYHVAAQVLKKKITEKSKVFASETTDFPSNYPADMKKNIMSFKNDIHENKLTTKSNIPIKDSKGLQVRKSGENVKRLPKAFLQKDLNTIADYIKPQRKRMHSREEVEYVKHPRHENYRNISPNSEQPPYQSSRHRSPVDEHRHQSPYHSRHRSPESDLRYKISSYHFKNKSPHRDYDRHSYEYNAKHSQGRWRHSRSPSRKSPEQSTRHYNYRPRSSRSYRSRERSPGLLRFRERSRSPESFRSRERSRTPEYHRSGDRSHEHEHKKDSYKSKELLSKGEPRDSESRNRKKAQNYSSDDSLCTLSLESESASSDSSDDIHCKKEKSTTKPTTKEKRTDNIKSLKTETSKNEKKVLEDIFVKADKSMLPDNISQNIADICNFQDKTSEDTGINEILNFFDKGNDNLNTIVKMFENSHLVREIVEGVHEHVNSLSQPITPPDAAHNTPEHVNSVTHPIPPLDAAHNTPNLLTPSSFASNVPFPNISSSEHYPIMPSVPIPFHPPPINSLPPLTFPPPPLVPPPVVPPPVIPLRVIPPLTAPPPSPASVSTSVYGSFPVSLPSGDVSRIPDTKQVKKRPATLRPINITMDMSSPSKSSKEHSSPSLVTSAESKDKKIEKEKTASEAFTEQNKIFIETYKKLKTEKHYAHVKVNSCVADMLEMRKIMDDTWGKKENPADRVFYSRCKNMLSASSSTMTECLKEAKRLDDELNRFKGLMSKEILDEIANIKIEEPPKYGNVHYSCYDTSNHTCYLCCKPFPNLLSILEHLHSAEHKEQMTFNDKDWTKKFKKPEKDKDDKNVVLQPVKGVEFMKPFTGYFCSLCSETLLDKSSAEQHLKSHDHYCQYKDYNFKNPIYEKKFFFKKFIQRSILSKAKEKRKMQEREQQLKKAEEANEKVKDALKNQKNKEKIVEDLDDDDADPLSSKNQSSSGIKLNLSSDKEKQNIKEGSKATKVPQRVVYIGKAPNFKARPKQPWYKKDIYQKNDESSSQSTESIPVVTLSKEKNSGIGREPSPSSNPDSLGDDIPEAVAVIKKGKATSKKVMKATCLTEEDSKKLDTSSSNASLSCKEKNSTVSNDPTLCATEGESKNLNTSCDETKHVSILSTENAQPVSGDSGSILNANASSKQTTSVQNTKDTYNQPESPANENGDDTIAISKDSTVNQALKNILLGTDSSVQEIPLNEIRLPDTHGQNSSNTPTNSVLHEESNIPVPMEIEDTNDESVFNPHPKLTTEEDRDLYILGINREDLIPLAVPVPPPSSLLNCASPSHSPATSSPRHNRSSTNKVSKSANESNIIPESVSTDLNKLLNLKKKTIEYSNNNSKYSKNSSNLIILTDNTLESESLLKSDTVETSIEFKNLITVCETMESSDVNENDVVRTAAVRTKCQDVNIESSVDTATNKEDSILQINEISLETTEAISLETDSVTEKLSQINDASGSNENEVISSDNKNLKKEPDTNLNLIEAAVQDGMTEKSSQISDASKSNKNLNEAFSSNKENLGKETDINLNLIEDVAQCKIANQITSAIDCIITKSEQANSDSISVSECKSSDSSNVADSVEIIGKSLVVKNSDNGICSSSIKPHDSNQNSDLEPAQNSADQNQVSSENNIPDMEVCAFTSKTIPVKDELDDIESTQDLRLGQSLNQDSSNSVRIPGKEVCKAVHMQDQESNIKPCQSLIIKQESSKESVSETCISPDILIRDQQSISDIKLHQNSEAKQLLNKVSVDETTPDMEVTISENSISEVVSEQSLYQDSHSKGVSDMEVCVSICETSPEVDQIPNSKLNLNLACTNNSIFSMQSSEKNVNTETIDVVVKEKVSEQLVPHTEMTFEKKEYDKLITTPSSTDLPTEIISDMKISSSIPESADINLTTSINNSSDGILDSHSSVIPEQCLSKNVSSHEVVRMEIDSEQQAIFTEKSQCDVKSDQDLSLHHSLNQNLFTESTSDVTEAKLLQECHTLKMSNETKFVEDKIDNMSADRTHLISQNLGENESFEMDNKNLQPEPVLISVKSECEVTPGEGFISQLSSNQCDSTFEKTASYAIDTSLPDEGVNEGLNPVHVSVTKESVSGQETTQQKLDAILENIATINKENEETLPDCNTSIISQMDENQAGSEINLKSPGLKGNIAGDQESKTQILSSSSSGELLETQNLAKSDTDTDEYENEE